jgi:hypothetical protein
MLSIKMLEILRSPKHKNNLKYKFVQENLTSHRCRLRKNNSMPNLPVVEVVGL